MSHHSFNVGMNIFYVYLLAWFGMVILAIANGVIREKTYGKSVSELTAHQISTLTGIILFGIYVFVLSRLQSIQSTRVAWGIGSAWLIMTISFEFLFGHYIAGHSWTKLINDYKINKGRLWTFVLLWIFISPYVFSKI